MLKEIDIAGIYVAPFVAYFAAAFGIFLVMRWLLVRVGFERWAWHPPLAEGGLFLVVLSLVVLYF